RSSPAISRQAAALSRRPAYHRDRLGRAVRRAVAVALARRSGGGRRLHARPSRVRVMAQLSEDCFAFGGTLLGVDAALKLIDERVTPVVGEEIVPLAQACGRILLPDLVAAIDV